MGKKQNKKENFSEFENKFSGEKIINLLQKNNFQIKIENKNYNMTISELQEIITNVMLEKLPQEIRNDINNFEVAYIHSSTNKKLFSEADLNLQNHPIKENVFWTNTNIYVIIRYNFKLFDGLQNYIDMKLFINYRQP